MTNETEHRHANRLTRRGYIVFILAMAITFLLGMLVVSIAERRREAALLTQIITPIPELEPDNSVWGENFARQYQRYRRTLEMGEPTRYGGSFPFDRLERNPRLLTLFQGYPFEKGYRNSRGHYYALDDVRETPRVDPELIGVVAPGTCLTCKSSDVPRLMQDMGVAQFYRTPFPEVSAMANHPIGCVDCHDERTMNLRVSRPALREAYAAMGRDIDQATRHEMRSLVCAQCHVEYYFAGATEEIRGTYLTFPWTRGLSIEEIEQYYTEDVRHIDWVHPISGTEMIKMQHPDYELFAEGIHAQVGVSCADCHMPYRSEGGVKFTDHHIRSPLYDIGNTCAVCHRWGEQETLDRVYAIQDSVHETLERTEIALIAAHNEVGQAMAAGATDEELAEARELIRRAQMRWDFVDASNGMGFHAPRESLRILASSIDLAQQARLLMAGLR